MPHKTSQDCLYKLNPRNSEKEVHPALINESSLLMVNQDKTKLNNLLKVLCTIKEL